MGLLFRQSLGTRGVFSSVYDLPGWIIQGRLDKVPSKHRCRIGYQRKLTRCFGSACDALHEQWMWNKGNMYQGSLMLLHMEQTHIYRMCTYVYISLQCRQTKFSQLWKSHCCGFWAFAVKSFTGWSSSVIQSRWRHYIIYAYSHINRKQFKLGLLLFKPLQESFGCFFCHLFCMELVLMC